MKQGLTTLLLFTLISTAFSQINYSGKIETGYLHFNNNTLDVDPGPGWKGYYLNENQNGIHVTFVNGLTFANRRIFTGIGIGYLNFEGISGTSIFGDIEYSPLKTKLAPLLNFKLGYNHIWNQYEGGTGTIYTELGLGIDYKIKKKTGLYITSGIALMQQSFLIPIALGIRF